MESQSDLFVLSNALEDCHQGTHIHLGGNVVVYHPVDTKIPHFHRVLERLVRRICVTCSGTSSNDNIVSSLMLLMNLSYNNASMTYASLICSQIIILYITVVFGQTLN